MHSRLGLNDCSLGDGSIRLDMSAYQVGMAVNKKNRGATQKKVTFNIGLATGPNGALPHVAAAPGLRFQVEVMFENSLEG